VLDKVEVMRELLYATLISKVTEFKKLSFSEKKGKKLFFNLTQDY